MLFHTLEQINYEGELRAMEVKSIIRELSALPPEAQREVADFIAFLRTRRPTSSRPARRKGKLRDEPFFGQWKNRKDIQVSVAYVRELRQREWGG